MPHFLLYLILNYSVIALCWVLGFLIFKLLKISKQQPYTDLFLKLIVGLTALTCINALISTKFNTILLGVPILFIITFFLNPKEDYSIIKSTNTNENLPFIDLAIVTFLFYCIRFFSTFKHGVDYLSLEHSDLIFYSRLSDYIGKTGLENINIDYLFPVELQPYHYSELWFINTINKLTLIPSILLFEILQNTLSMVLIWSGIIAITEQKFKLTVKLKTLILLLVFLRPFYFQFYKHVSFISQADVFALSFLTKTKFLFIELFLLLSILLEIQQKRLLAIASILVIPMFYTTTFPSIVLSFILYFAFLLFFNKILKPNELIISVTSIGYIILFYFILHKYASNENKSFNFYTLFQFKYIKTMINIYGGTAIAIFLLYFPFVIIFLYYLLKNNITSPKGIFLFLKSNPLVLMIISIPAFGLIMWSFAIGNGDGVQLFYNVSVPILNTLSIFLVIWFFTFSPSKLSYPLCMILLIYTTYDIINIIKTDKIEYNHAFLKKVELLSKNINPIGISYQTPEIYTNLFSKNTNVFNLGNYMCYFKHHTQIISINALSIPITKDTLTSAVERKLIFNTTFYKYVKKLRSNNIYKSEAEYQLDFIKSNNIQYLITTKSTKLPLLFDTLVKERVSDPISGEVFCIIK